MKEEEIKNDVEWGNPPLDKQERTADIFGMFQTVTAVPTKEPVNSANQIQIYSSGGVFRAYFYDTVSHTWKYASLL